MSKKIKRQLESSEKKIVSTDVKKGNPITIKYNDGVFQIIENYKGGYDGFGIENDAMLDLMLNQIISSSTQNNETLANGAIAMYQAINPQDDMECLFVAQIVAVHNMVMEMSTRTMRPDQTVEGVDTGVNRVAKLMRTFAIQMETLKKYRTGGKQTIQVQHVNVNQGGQAVVGNIRGGGGNG